MRVSGIESEATPTVTPGRSGPWWLGPWIPVVLGALVFLGTLKNDFTYDDRPIVRQNPRIRDITNARDIWLTDWWVSRTDDANEVRDPQRDRLYRPLTLFTLALNYLIGALNPTGYHAVNILLHALTCGLVWMLARRITGDALAAFVAGVLFAIHPVHVEAVAGIVGRAELLSAVSLLVGLLALLPAAGLPAWGRLIAASIAFLLALLAKETAICYPALAAVVLWRRLRHIWPRGLILLTPLLVYFPLRFVALEGHLIRSGIANAVNNPLVEANGWGRIHGPLTILGEYVRLLLWPRSLSSDYGLAVFDPASGPNLFTLVGIAAVIALLFAIVFWFLKPRPLVPEQGNVSLQYCLGACAAMFVASYVLISNALLLIGVPLAERLMYWPSAIVLIGVGAALAVAIHRQIAEGRTFGRVAPIAAAGLVLSGLLAWRTTTRGAEWADDTTLFTADMRTHPESVQMNTCFAFIAVQEAGKTRDMDRRDQILKEANAALDRALKRRGMDSKALQGKGIVAELLGDIPSAMKYYSAAVQLNVSDQFSMAQIARLSGAGSDQASQIRTLREQIDKNPRDAELHRKLGDLLLTGARNVDALREYETATQLAPDDVNILRGYAQALLVNRLNDRAREAYQRLVPRDPTNWRAHANLASLLGDREPAATLVLCEQAARLAPSDLDSQVTVQCNLAQAYAINGRLDDARRVARALLDKLPADDPNRGQVEAQIRGFDPK